MKKFILLSGALLLGRYISVGQNPIADFNTALSPCISQELQFSNTSQNATSYVWDFCDKDLNANPMHNTLMTFPTSGSPFYHSVKLVNDQGLWIGFIVDTGGKIYRIAFGNSIDNDSPSQPELLNVSGLTSSGPIDFINEGGVWYALVVNIFQNNIVRLTFGNGLSSDPTLAENLGNIGGLLNTPSGVQIVKEQNDIYCFVPNYSGNTVTVIKYGSSILNSPSLTKNVGQAPINGPYGISYINKNDNYILFVGSLNTDKIYSLNFGGDFSADPILVEINVGISAPVEIEVVTEGDTDYALIRSHSLGIFRVHFEANFSNPIAQNLNVSNSLSRSLTLLNTTPTWTGFTIEASTGVFSRIDFKGTCSTVVSRDFSIDDQPGQVYYKQPGDFKIELTAFANGQSSTIQKSLAVQNLISSGVSIMANDNQCLTGTSSFSANALTALTDFSWDFGDGTPIDLSPNPQHIFNNTGNYLVRLNATEENGCSNIATINIPIYSVPQSEFDLPLIPIKSCTLQDYEFFNQSIYDLSSNPTWSWLVDGSVQSNTQNLNHIFTQTGTVGISLKTEIPGCSNTISKDFVLEAEGVLVDFNSINLCENAETYMINTSVGVGSSFSWDFGDGQISIDENPNHLFPSIGSYNVTFEVTNSAGCVNSKSKNILITSTPSPAFYVDLPPFSCAGTPTQFQDNTSAMPDSNIASWLWQFNDGTEMTANTQNPLHTFSQAGSYNVDLEVETNYGCKSSITLPVTIAPSPTSDFIISPSCLDKPTLFTNTSSSGIQSLNWIINGTNYSVTSPFHTFANAGNYSATLTVVSANLCENSLSKQIEIEPIPNLNFITSAICATQETTFTDQSTGNDLPLSWNWNFGSGNTSTGSPTTYSFPSVGIFPVEMSVITEAGCSYSFSKNISVMTPPIASFTTTTSFGPPPLLVQFNSTSSNASALMWNFNDPAASSSAVPNPLFTFTELGDYNVELTAFNSVGCSDTFSKSINVLIPNIDLSLDDLKVQKNIFNNSFSPIVSITNKSNVPIANVGIIINGSNGSRITTSIQTNLSAGGNGEFVVPLELRSNDSYLCTELSVVGDFDAMNNARCINLANRTVIVLPYPNPSGGDIVFEAVLPEAGAGSLNILDSKGKLIFNNEFPELIAGMNQLHLDLSGAEPGLYLAIWIINGQKSVVKFLIQ